MCWSRFPSTSCLKRLSFLHGVVLSFCTSLTLSVWFISVLYILFLWSICLSLCQWHTILITLALSYVLKPGSIKPSAFLFGVSCSISCILGLFHFWIFVIEIFTGVAILFTVDSWTTWLSRCLSGKASTCQCSRHRNGGFSLWVGKIPWRKEMTAYSSILA